MISSYSTLAEKVQRYLARDDVAGDVPGFIWNFERRFVRQPKNHGMWMEKALDATTTNGVIAVPADYLTMKYAYVNGGPSSRLEWVSLDQCYGRYPRGGHVGTPCWMSRDVSNFVFGPVPDAEYTIRGVYYAKPQSMKDSPNDAQDHWLIVNAPDLCLYGALLEAEAFVQNDERVALWRDFYGQALKDYRDLIEAEANSMVAQEVLA